MNGKNPASSAIDRLATYPRLSERRSSALLSQARMGDLAAEEMLIRHTAKLLRYIVNSLNCPQSLVDDLFQEGQIALKNAIGSYRADLGLSWDTFAYICAWRKMRSALIRSSNTYLHSIDAPALISSLTDEEKDGPEEELMRICDQVYIQEHLCMLTTRERKVVCSSYALEAPYKPLPELATELGISTQRVHQIRERALQKLRMSMTGKERSTAISA